MRKFTYWLIGLLLIGLAFVAVLLLTNFQEIPWQAAQNTTLTATQSDSGGVELTSAFMLSFDEDISANTVRRYLQVNPEIEINVHQGLVAAEILITPTEPLSANQTYTFSLQTDQDTLQWAYQTKGELQISGHQPLNAQNDINPNQEIVLNFNEALPLNLNQIEQYISIEPAFEYSCYQQANSLFIKPDQALKPATVYTVKVKSGLKASNSDMALADDISFSFATAALSSPDDNLKWQPDLASAVFMPGQSPVFNAQIFEEPPAPPLNELDDEAIDQPPSVFIPEYLIEADLYLLADAEAFAALSLRQNQNTPLWSNLNPTLFDINDLQLSQTQTINANRQEDGSYNFSWPDILPNGYYLLRASYLGQAYDLLFQVSELKAYLVKGAEQSLVWVHDQNGAAAEAKVWYYSGDLEMITDEFGLADFKLNHQMQALDSKRRSFSYQDIYIISHQQQELVLCDFELQQANPNLPKADILGNLDLALSQNSQGHYQLSFWGYMQRLDGLSWDWDRVSVYLEADHYPQPLFLDYAALNGHYFAADFDLGYLLDADYQLQIWQSGQLLLSENFYTGTKDVDLTIMPPSSADGQNSPLELSAAKDAYSQDENYNISLNTEEPLDFRPLVFKVNQDIITPFNGDITAINDTFGEQDLSGTYWQAVSFNGQNYHLSEPLKINPATGAYQAIIELTELDNNQFDLSVTDAAGQPLANTRLEIVVADQNYQPDSVLAEVYNLNQALIMPDMASTAPNLSYNKQAKQHISLITDDLGQANFSQSEPLLGDYYLHITAIYEQSLPLIAQLSYKVEQESVVSISDYYTIEQGISYELTDGQLWPTDAAIYMGEEAPAQALDIIWQNLFAISADSRQILATALAQSLWADYGDEPLNLQPNLADYSRNNGGLARTLNGNSDLQFSFLAALSCHFGLDLIDKNALAAYWQNILFTGNDFSLKAQAYAALAALDYPIINDLHYLLSLDNTPLEQAYLLLALILGDDSQSARNLWRIDPIEAQQSDDQRLIDTILLIEAILAPTEQKVDFFGQDELLDLWLVSAILAQVAQDQSYVWHDSDMESGNFSLIKAYGYQAAEFENATAKGIDLSRDYRYIEDESGAHYLLITLNYNLNAAAAAGQYLLADYPPKQLNHLQINGLSSNNYGIKDGMVLVELNKEQNEELAGSWQYMLPLEEQQIPDEDLQFVTNSPLLLNIDGQWLN